MPSGDILRATLQGRFAGEPVMIGLGFVSNSGAPTFQEEAASLAGALSTVLDLAGGPGAFFGPLSAQFSIDAIRVSDLAPAVSASALIGVGAGGANVTDDAMPPNDALCVTWRTDLKGKENRGRSYLTGFAEDANNAGYWIAEIQEWAGVAFAQPLMDAFGPFGSGNYALSIVHTQSGGTRLIPPTATPITGYTVNNTVRTLRRRAVGVRISRRPTV